MGFFVVSTLLGKSIPDYFSSYSAIVPGNENPLFAVARRRETIARDANDPEDEKVKTFLMIVANLTNHCTVGERFAIRDKKSTNRIEFWGCAILF